MKNEIYELYSSSSFRDGEFIRYGKNRDLNLYIGRDEMGRYSFDFRGVFVPSKIIGSQVIDVKQLKDGRYIFLRFSLGLPELLECFCTFCEDLIISTNNITSDILAYTTLCQRYFSWKKLFRPDMARLSEPEIMGLIGELLFLKEYMIPKWGEKVAVESWTGPEKTHKDFSLEQVWYEIKAVSSGKDSVRISSFEQLDSNINGFLCVYNLERMSPSFDGIKINALVNELILLMPNTSIKELFMSKLELYRFDFASEYDNLVYSNTAVAYYLVNDSFPRLRRAEVSGAISRVQYDLTLSHLEEYKQRNI